MKEIQINLYMKTKTQLLNNNNIGMNNKTNRNIDRRMIFLSLKKKVFLQK